jgi:hypothetical protein
VQRYSLCTLFICYKMANFPIFMDVKNFILATGRKIVYNVQEYASVCDAQCSIFVNERNVFT